MKNRPISVRIHPAGGMALAAAALLLDSRMVLAACGALILHEGAHLTAMRLCGMTECTIELTPFGGMADVRSFDAYPPWKRMICAAAGLLASAAVSLLCVMYAPRTIFWERFLESNLSLALVNALPAWPLDGARICTAMAAKMEAERSVRNVLSWLTTVVGVLLTGLGLFGIWHGVLNPSLLLMGPYLCYAARSEQIASKIRRLSSTEEKMDQNVLLPVKIWAGNQKNATTDTFGILLGRVERDQYCLMIQVDDDQKITRIWTEGEMLDYLLNGEPEKK